MERHSASIKPSQAIYYAHEQRDIAQGILKGESITQETLVRIGELALITADLSERRYFNTLSNLVTEEVVREKIETILSDPNLQPAALLCFDLTGFKRINDDCGHQDGDKFLVSFANTLEKNVREGKGDHAEKWASYAKRFDVPAQISTDSLHAHPHGDEFYAIVHTKNRTNLKALARKMLLRILKDASAIGEGVSVIGDDEIDKSQLLSLVREYSSQYNLEEFGARVNIAKIGGKNKTAEDVLRAADATHEQRVAEFTVSYSNGKILLTDKIEQERLRVLNDLLIKHELEDHIATLEFSGKLDRSTMHRFYDSFLPYIDDFETRHIIADMTKVGVFDIRAASALISICSKISDSKDSPLNIIFPDQTEMLDMFRLAGRESNNFRNVFSVEEAKSRLAPLVVERYTNKQKTINWIMSIREKYEKGIEELLGDSEELTFRVKKELKKSKRLLLKKPPFILVRFGLDEVTKELSDEQDDLTKYAQNIGKDVLPYMLLALNKSPNISYLAKLGENSFAAIIPNVSGESTEITWRRMILKEVNDMELFRLISLTPEGEMGLQVGFSTIDCKTFSSPEDVINNAGIVQEVERFKPDSPNGILFKKGHSKSEWFKP